MLRRDATKIENYFEAFFIILLLILFFYMIKNFLLPMFLAGIFVFLLNNFYQKLVKKTRNKVISALFILFITVTIMAVFTYFISTTLIAQTTDFLENSVAFPVDWHNCQYSFCNTIEKNIKRFNIEIGSVLQKVGNYLLDSITGIFKSIPKFVVDVAIFILAFFYLLIDGKEFIAYMKRIIPMRNEYKDALFVRFRDVSKAVFLDTILVALIQGILLGIGFKIVGIHNAVFWGTIGAFFALIPIFGTAIVWVPAVTILLFTGHYVAALVLCIYSAILVSLSDNIIRMIDLNKKIRVHPFIILISVLGGISVFGVFGLFLGPIIISLIITVFQLYKLNFY